MQMPIKFLESNLAFNAQGEIWAAYRLEPWHYEHLSGDERLALLHRMTLLFTNLEGFDGQMLLVPVPHRVLAHFETLAGEAGGPLTDQSRRYCETVSRRLNEVLPAESADYVPYLCLKLPPQQEQKRDFLRSLWSEPKRFMEELAGVQSAIRTEAEVTEALQREEMLYQRLARLVRAFRATPAEVGHLIRRSFFRGIGDPEPNPDWQPDTVARLDSAGRLSLRNATASLVALAEGDLDLSNPRRIGLTQLHGPGERTGYAAFLALATLPDELPFPGGEWLYSLQDLPFPVEVCLRWHCIRHSAMLSLVRRKKLDISDQGDHTQSAGEDLPLSLVEAHSQALRLEHDLTQRRIPMLEMSCLFAVSGADVRTLHERVDRVRDHFRSLQMGVEVPTGDQLYAMFEFFPGAPHQLTDYRLVLPAEVVAASLFMATRSLGDLHGPYLGRIGLLNKPVYLDPALPPRVNRSASVAFLGTLGGGKSFAANLLAYQAVMVRAARVLILDPKGERSTWPNLLPELAGSIHLISLTPAKADNGKLDPFVMGRDLPEEDRKEVGNLALSLLCFLTGAGTGDDKFLALMDAVERVKRSARPSMRQVVRELAAMGAENPAAGGLARYLEALSEQAYANLLFGHGDESGLNVTSPMTILQLQRLQMPPAGKPQPEFTMEEMLSLALMHAVTAFATLFTRRERGVFKVVLLDEAWAVLASTQGRALVANLLRTGRAMNNAVYLVTQNTADLLDETIRNNIGVKLVFRSHDHEEIARVLRFLNLEANDENVLAVRNLETGSALLQDLDGRVGVVKIDAVLPHLAAAFDTRPPAAGKTP